MEGKPARRSRTKVVKVVVEPLPPPKLGLWGFIKKAYLGLGVLSLAWMFGYYVWFEPSWLSYTLPLKLAHQEPVAPGQPIPLIVSRCNTSGKLQTYTAARQLERVDSEQAPITLTAATFSAPAGCHATPSVAHIVPEKFDGRPFPWGRYRLHGSSNVAATIRNVQVEFYSEEFDVKGPPQ